MNALIERPLTGEVIAPSEMIRVIGKTHPLSGGRIECRVRAGLSIFEILMEALSERPDLQLRRDFAVHIDGHYIEEKNWAKVRVKLGATVTFTPYLQGDNPLRTILGVAVAIGALLVAGPLGSALAASAFGTAIGLSAAVGTALIAGGIMLAGTLALNALFPVSPAAIANSSNVNSTSLNSIQGAQNQSNPFGPIPVVLGKHRQSPYYAAKPYTEILGDDQYLRLLFCLGYGPLQIEDLQIGETPLSSFTDYQIEIQQGIAGDPPITLYPGEVDEQALSIVLTSVAGWQLRTTAVDTDQISIDVTAPQGIYSANSSTGNLDAYQVVVDAQYSVAGANSWTDIGTLTFNRSTGAQRQGLLQNVPRGQYDVRVQKTTVDANNVNVHDEVDWTALRSIKSAPAVAFPKPLALVALRIKATDQLSGVVDTFNCVTTSLVESYSGTGSTWADNTASQNPSDLFRWVLQGPANARPVPDAQIDIANLQDWWTYCVGKGFKFNQVITSVGSVYDKLCDIAAAGRGVPTFIDGKWGVIWDRPTDSIVQHFTPRNSWGFQGQHPYAQQPNGWRVSFINEANGYTQDERIVYDDGFDATNATLFEGIQFPGVTDPNLIWMHGRFQIAQSRLRPEKISLNAGWENLVCTRGDRVAVTHDVLLVGLGSGRVKSVDGQIVTFDETVTVEDGKTYGMSFRLASQTSPILRALDPSPGTAYVAGDYNSLTLVGDLTGIKAGTLFAFGETDQEYAVYRLQGIAHQKDLIASLTLVDDAPAISQADQGTIPAYTPNISIPADPFTLAPRNLQYQQVIDGQGASANAVVILTWQVPRFGNIASFEVQQRDDGGMGSWATVDSVLPPHTQSELPLISAGNWSFRVRCIFTNGTASDWSTLSSLNLLGLSLPPGDITNFRDAIIAGRTHLVWDQVLDPRTIFYEIRKGGTSSWDAAQVVGDTVIQPPWQTVGDGTYLIAAYVVSPFGVRVYSTTKAMLVIGGSVLIDNVVVSHDEQAEGFTGYFSGTLGVDGGFLRTSGAGNILTESSVLDIASILDSGDQGDGLYLSKYVVDIGQIAACRVSMDWEAIGVGEGDNLLTEDVLSDPDVLRAALSQYIRVYPVLRLSQDGAGDAFSVGDIFAADDAFFAGTNWSDLLKWSPDYYKARMFQVGLRFEILRPEVIGYALKFKWTIDVPDRLDRYQNLNVPIDGLNIVFSPDGSTDPVPFIGGPDNAPTPHLLGTIIAAQAGDEPVEFTNITKAGCTARCRNNGVYVARPAVNVMAQGY